MGILYEYTGVVKKLNEVQKFDSGFYKREIILTDDIGADVKFPNILAFTFKKERVSKLDPVRPGQRVKIVFAIDGREWIDNSGQARYYTDLTGLKLDVLAGGEEPQAQKPVGTTSATDADSPSEDMPF